MGRISTLDFVTILFFFLIIIILIVCYIAYSKGKFNKFKRIHFLFAGFATIFPIIDIIQTWSALRFGVEGNPLLLYILTGLPQALGWLLFILAHLAFSALGLYLGWRGKDERRAEERTLVAFFGLLWATLVIWNSALMVMYRMF
jgi:hypothetical protein